MNHKIISPPDDFLIDIEPQEVWIFKEPIKGDHIRVNRGLYYHHGIFVSKQEVIHFSTENDDDILGNTASIISTDYVFFLQDGRVEVKDYTPEEFKDLYPVQDIVNYARACLGDAGYKLLFNNCEHFANVCTLGKHRSRQAEKVIGQVTGKEKIMGFFGDVIGGIGRFLFGSSDKDNGTRRTASTTTVYEPDKVKVAEIRKEKEIELAKLNGAIQKAMLEAQVRGLLMLNESLMNLMKEINLIAEQQFQLIENSSLDAVKNIEAHYMDLAKEVMGDRNHFDDKFVEMLSKLEQFQPDSAQFNIYSKRLDAYSQGEVVFFNNALKQIQLKSQKLIDSTLENKKLINENITKIVSERLQQVSIDMADKQKLIAQQGQKMSQHLSANNINDDEKEIPIVTDKSE